jgi:hypothetical protein
LKIIRHWINFYNEHLETIIHGDFKPQLHYGHVPLICFQSASEQIIGLYDNIPVQLGLDAGTTWLLNASTRPYVSVPDSVINTTCRAVFRDKFGQVTEEKTLEMPVSTLNVEIGGSVELWSQHQG